MTSPGVFFQRLDSYRADVKGRIDIGQNSAITTINRATPQPAWVSYLPYSDVTYPMILNAVALAFGDTGAQTAGTAHTHSLNGTGYAGASYYGISVNNSMGAYISCGRNAQISTLAIVVKASTALAGGQVLFQLYRELPDGSLVQLLSENIASFVTTTQQIIPLTIPGGFVVREGERYVVRIANKTSPSRTLQTLGLQESSLASPDVAHETVGTTDTAKTTLTTVEATAARTSGVIIPWAMMASDDPPPEDRFFSDDFNNRANVGPSWSWDTIALGADGELGTSGGHLVYTGSDGVAQTTFIHPVAGDSMRLDFDAHEIAGTDADDIGIAGMVCWDRQAFTGAAVFVNSEKAYIFSRASGTWTQRASVASVGNDCTWSLYYDPATNAYTVLKNNEDISLSWTDSGNVVPHNENFRYAALQITQDSGTAGGEIDNFKFYDYAP